MMNDECGMMTNTIVPAVRVAPNSSFIIHHSSFIIPH
jgi:hypothetical protein